MWQGGEKLFLENCLYLLLTWSHRKQTWLSRGKIELQCYHPFSHHRTGAHLPLMGSACWNKGEPHLVEAEVPFQVMMLREQTDKNTSLLKRNSFQRTGMNVAYLEILRGLWADGKRNWRSGWVRYVSIVRDVFDIQIAPPISTKCCAIVMSALQGK